MINVALAGNANCGKTTLFNALTGANQFVGNWPGVTVEKKSGRLKTQGCRHSRSSGHSFFVSIQSGRSRFQKIFD